MVDQTMSEEPAEGEKDERKEDEDEVHERMRNGGKERRIGLAIVLQMRLFQ